MIKIIALEDDQVDMLVNLTEDYRSKVESGDVTGYGQSRDLELHDVDATLAALRA